jgi:uncharacterized protein
LTGDHAEGWLECSYEDGVPSLVRVLDEHMLTFPSHDGKGLFRSLCNLLVNPRERLLFINFELPRRLRVGLAAIDSADPLIRSFEGAQRVVWVRVTRISPNCPRDVLPMKRSTLSDHAPRDSHAPPDAAWKQFKMSRDVLPRS